MVGGGSGQRQWRAIMGKAVTGNGGQRQWWRKVESRGGATVTGDGSGGTAAVQHWRRVVSNSKWPHWMAAAGHEACVKLPVTSVPLPSAVLVEFGLTTSGQEPNGGMRESQMPALRKGPQPGAPTVVVLMMWESPLFAENTINE